MVLRDTKNSAANALLGGQAAVVDARVDLLPQHVGDLTRTVRARLA